jgi:hypothetical protein
MGKAGTKQLRSFIVKVLEENGPMTTGEILEAYNEKYVWGTNMNILGNVLPKEAIRVGYINKQGNDRIRNAVWGSKGVA